LTSKGPVSALGTALDDLAGRTTGNLAGLVIISDFDRNTGEPAGPAAKRLGVKIYTVGVGATEAVDLSVALDPPLLMKKGELETVIVTLRQEDLTKESAKESAKATRFRWPPSTRRSAAWCRRATRWPRSST